MPPLPQAALQLRQLQAEASYYATTELAEAAAAAAAALEAAAAQALQHAAAQRLLDTRRAEALQVADAAVQEAQAWHADAEAQPQVQRLRDAERRMEAAEQGGDEWIDALQAVENMNEEPVHSEIRAERQAALQLRDALLARLCALGADLPAAEAQLRATHPELACRKLD